jgi:hypothetical protein
VTSERLSLSSSADREDLAQNLLHAHERPVAWCVLDWATEQTAGLTDLLVASWGPGLCYQPGLAWAEPSGPAVLPKPAVSRILRAARTRVWSSDDDEPDREHVMESLEHGCLPLQYTSNAPTKGEEGLGDAARAMLLRADASGSLEPLDDEEFRSRVEVVAEALVTGQLEDDLSHEDG